MSQDEERQRRSRVVVETPTARREEVYTQTRRVPHDDRRGVSTGVVAAVALTAIALTAIVVFFLMNSGSDATQTGININAATPVPTVPTPLVIQQQTPLPAMTPPPPQTIIVQPAPGTTTTQPIVVPPATTTTTAPASAALKDADVESSVNKALLDDSQLGTLGISVIVVNGRATLNGNVNSADLKARAERLARSVRGVSGIDNKIVVEAPPE
jgi:hypothetical protein